MTKTAFAVAIAALLMLAASGTSQAVPIAPPTGVNSTDNGAVTPVYWYHHRHCWRGYYRHVHCRW